jgi:hypothetical protein
LIKANEPPKVWYTETLFMIKDRRVLMCVYDKRAANYNVVLMRITPEEYHAAMAAMSAAPKAAAAAADADAANPTLSAAPLPPLPPPVEWKLQDAKSYKQVDFCRLKEILSHSNEERKTLEVNVGGILRDVKDSSISLTPEPSQAPSCRSADSFAAAVAAATANAAVIQSSTLASPPYNGPSSASSSTPPSPTSSVSSSSQIPLAGSGYNGSPRTFGSGPSSYSRRSPPLRTSSQSYPPANHSPYGGGWDHVETAAHQTMMAIMAAKQQRQRAHSGHYITPPTSPRDAYVHIVGTPASAALESGNPQYREKPVT